MAYAKEYEACRAQIEQRLNECFLIECPQKQLLDAMRYSLLAGGKRIRPVLTMKFCQAAGGDPQNALDFACGVEMLHTYSLIHDDLPCMDNDDLRRGKPTCHKVFGETVATLAGDALQAAAFRMVLSATEKDDTAKALAASALAEAAGEQGMCGGQFLDIEEHARHSEEELYAIHTRKTGALLRAACVMGVYAAGGHGERSEKLVRAAEKYAENLGLAFQIQDDILDVTATTEVLGKPVGSDAVNQKTTYVSLFGVDVCREMVRKHTAQAKDALEGVFSDSGFLCWLADLLAEREH